MIVCRCPMRACSLVAAVLFHGQAMDSAVAQPASTRQASAPAAPVQITRPATSSAAATPFSTRSASSGFDDAPAAIPGTRYSAAGVDLAHVAPPAVANDPRQLAIEKLNSARQRFAQAAPTEQRNDVREEVRVALEEYFDQDLEYRRKALEGLGGRADATEAALERREASRGTMIALEVRRILMIADGLAVLGAEEPAGFNDSAPRSGLVTFSSSDSVSRAVAGQPFSPAPSAGPMDEARPQSIAEQRTIAMHRIVSLRQKLKAASEESVRTELTTELSAALGDYFDADLNVRRDELAGIRADIVRMQNRLDQRASSKTEAVALQLQVIENEADGLEFFSSDVDRAASPSGNLTVVGSPYGPPWVTSPWPVYSTYRAAEQ